MLRSTLEHAGTGIRWKVTTTIKDLDLALISSTFTSIQTKIDRMKRNEKETGLKFSTKKTKLMRINPRNSDDAGKEKEEADGFDYLGAKSTKYGGTDDTIKSRLGNAGAASNTLANIWRSGQLSKYIKIGIFKSNVLAVLLYGE